ncbi:MAG: hypothetical protein SO297_02075 [Clostridium paraputrificum]|nr:hypothetical protein [Clostridium paraputrificum]MDY4720714.1 hypothetical protein [Clostridium paraputrificum]
MKSLKEYFNKKVRILDIDNKEFKGYVTTYTPAIDSEEELEEISILDKANNLIGFNEDEISSIEEI